MTVPSALSISRRVPSGSRVDRRPLYSISHLATINRTVGAAYSGCLTVDARRALSSCLHSDQRISIICVVVMTLAGADGPPLLRVREVAERLQVVDATVYRMVSRGDLHAVPLGRGPRPRLRIPSESLSALVSGRGVGEEL